MRERAERCRSFGLAGLVLALAGAAGLHGAPGWTTVRTPHFTVLTAAAPRTAQAWAADLERFRAGLGEILPVDQTRLTPVVVVIFPSDRAFRPYKILQHGKPAEVGGYFARMEAVSAIGLAIDYDPRATRRIIFHEATHWFFSARAEHPPLWLEEGLAEVFSTFEADEKNFTVGDAIGNHVRFLRREGMIPLEMLFGTTGESLDYHETERTGRFYAESWLLVHWAMFGHGYGSPGPGSLARYLAELKTASDPETAFVAAMGGNYKTVYHRLRHYLESGEYVRKERALPQTGLAPIPAPRPATEAEVEFALGVLLLGGRGPAEALPHLAHAVQLAPENLAAWEALGFAQLRQGSDAEALAAFDHATRLGSRNAMVWCDHAALRQEEELPAGDFVETTDWKLLGETAQDYRRAIVLDPTLEAAYRGLAGVVSGAEPADAGDLARLEQGRRHFPDDAMIAMGVGAVRLRSGDHAVAEKELRVIMDRTDVPATVQQLARSALEGELMHQLNGEIAAAAGTRDYGKVLARMDEALAGNLLSPENRRRLAAQRKETDQIRRLEKAVSRINQGQAAEAAAILQAILDEPPQNGTIRSEAERLLKACRGE